jgi:hypothetical protein
MLGNGFVDVGLMDYFGDELGHIIDQGRVRGGDLGAVDGIGRAIFDEEGEQGEDAAHEEGNDQDINDEEDGEASTHGDDGARSVGDEPGTSRTLPASRRRSIARAEGEWCGADEGWRGRASGPGYGRCSSVAVGRIQIEAGFAAAGREEWVRQLMVMEIRFNRTIGLAPGSLRRGNNNSSSNPI